MTDDQIIDGLLVHEGSYVDHPDDRGGPTNYGITQATLSRWRGRDVSRRDVRDLTMEEARDIYQALYVEPFHDIDPDVKPQVVDIAVHSGPARARALLAKAEAQTTRPVGVQLVIERLEFYAGIVQGNPRQAVFLRGWITRAVSFL